MNGTRRIVIGAAAALGLAFAATAGAHPGGGMGPGHGGMGHGHGMGGGQGACAQGEGGASFCGARGAGPGFGRGNPAAASEGRLSSLKSELAITPAQEKAWNAYSAAVRARAAEAQGLRGKAAEAGIAAPERFAQRAEVMKQRVAGMEAMAAAVKDLYAVLTPEQKAIADQQLARGGPGRMAFAGRGWR